MKHLLKSLLFIFATMCALPAFADETLTNLTDTYWYFKNGIGGGSDGNSFFFDNWGKKRVNWTDQSGGTHNGFTTYTESSRLRVVASSTEHTPIMYAYPDGWADSKYLLVHITGGTDVTDSTLIEKLRTFATQVDQTLASCTGIIREYESATGTVSQNGTPTPTNPIEPTFYTQGDMVLRKLNNTYYDSYDATTGKITRRVGVKVLTPSVLVSPDFAPNAWDGTVYFVVEDMKQMDEMTVGLAVSNYFPNASMRRNVFYFRNVSQYGINSVDDFKAYLTQQANAGTPVTIWYPLETPVEETVGTTYCADPIKIATTAYNDAQFAPVEAALETAVTTIKDVVANTIVQADAIQNLQDTKQTMPDASGTNGTCPKFRQCLLIETANGTPQWFQIADPVHDLVLSLKNNKVNSSGETTNYEFAAGSKTDPDSRYFNGYSAMRLQTEAGSDVVYTRQFTDANLSGGQYKTLGDQEWAVTWDGNETGTPNSFLSGVIYGTSRCVKTSEAPTTNFATKVNPDTTGWTTVENSNALNDLENIESYMSCFCKMTAVGLDGVITPVRDSSLAPWVFLNTYNSASECAYYCARGCTLRISDNRLIRPAIMGWAVE